MKLHKLIPILVCFILLSSLSLAADKEISRTSSGLDWVTCDNCINKSNVESTCKDTLCTYKFYKKESAAKTTLKYTLKLKYVTVFVNSQDSELSQIIATKNTKDKQDINDYMTHMSKDDTINFQDIDTFTYSVMGYTKEGKGIRPVEFCGEQFEGVAGEKTAKGYSQGRISTFNVQRRQAKGSPTKKCEITYYKLYNIEDESKKDDEPYKYKCGDISYLAGGRTLEGINCLPKIEFTGKNEANRKNESKLYCDKKDETCKKSLFILQISSKRFKEPLKVVIFGKNKETMEKVEEIFKKYKMANIFSESDFDNVLSKKDPKTKADNKILTASSFLVGFRTFTPKPKGSEKPMVTFVEEAPHMYVPNSIEVKTWGKYKNLIRYKYLPEFFGTPPPGQKFEGYNFRFKQYTLEVVYPFGITTWTSQETQKLDDVTGNVYHVGLKLTGRYKGGFLTITEGKKKRKIPKEVEYEVRVKGTAFSAAEQKKAQVQCKDCREGDTDCKAAISCRKEKSAKRANLAPADQNQKLTNLNNKAQDAKANKGCNDLQGSCFFFDDAATQQKSRDACRNLGKKIILGLCRGSPKFECCGISLCNHDGKCGPNETYWNCPHDCKNKQKPVIASAEEEEEEEEMAQA